MLYTDRQKLTLELHLEALQQLRPGCALASIPTTGAQSAAGTSAQDPAPDVTVEEALDVPRILETQAEIIAFGAEESQLALEFVAPPNEAHVSTLERREVGIEIRELYGRETSEVGEAIVGGVLVHDEGDVLHVLGPEPARHGSLFVFVITYSRWAI